MKTIVPIKGMHCRSCEVIIGDELRKIPSIRKIDISYRKSQAVIFSDNSLTQEEIKEAIERAGYEVGQNDSKDWINKNAGVYNNLFVSIIVLAFFYFIFRKLNINFDFSGVRNPSNLAVVFIVGLTAGISTCMALVGGLVLGISARHAEKHQEASSIQKFRPHLFFNIGRIASYFLLGGVVGLIGSSFQLSALSLGIITIFVGVLMLILGLQIIEIFPRISSSQISLPNSIAQLLGIKKNQEKEYSHANAVILGALTFFLPCGFTQAMQIYALSTGNFLSAALIMGIFALGTTPGLLGIGGLTSVIGGAFAKKFYVFAGVLIIALAIFNLRNGYHLVGLKINIFASNGSGAEISDPNVTIENGIQVVRMKQVLRGYEPNHFIIRNNMPVKWIISSVAPATCAATIYSRELGISTYLHEGENVFEFTPTKTGQIAFSCSMGMYKGYFEVKNG